MVGNSSQFEATAQSPGNLMQVKATRNQLQGSKRVTYTVMVVPNPGNSVEFQAIRHQHQAPGCRILAPFSSELGPVNSVSTSSSCKRSQLQATRNQLWASRLQTTLGIQLQSNYQLPAQENGQKTQCQLNSRQSNANRGKHKPGTKSR